MEENMQLTILVLSTFLAIPPLNQGSDNLDRYNMLSVGKLKKPEILNKKLSRRVNAFAGQHAVSHRMVSGGMYVVGPRIVLPKAKFKYDTLPSGKYRYWHAPALPRGYKHYPPPKPISKKEFRRRIRQLFSMKYGHTKQSAKFQCIMKKKQELQQISRYQCLFRAK